MKLAHWLLIALMGTTVSCGGEDSAISGKGADDSDSDSDSDSDTGSSNNSSSSGSTPKPGKGVSSNTPRTSAGTGMISGTSSDDDDACSEFSLVARPKSPEILIVLDRSGSMLGGGGGGGGNVNRWDPSVRAVKTVTKDLTETVKFGLMLFPAPGARGPNAGIAITGAILGGIFGGMPLPTDPGTSCMPGKVDVPVKLQSAATIASALDKSPPDPLGSTPTAASLLAAQAFLEQKQGPDVMTSDKYVLLVTDGQPTCGAGGVMGTPEDVAATNAAIDKLTESKIKTYVVGFGIEPAVAPTMDSFAMHGGTEKYLPVEDEQSLVKELTRITGQLVPCEYELDQDLEKPEFVRVDIDGKTYEFGPDWTIEGRKVILNPDAPACAKLRDARIHDLKITQQCKPVRVI